MYSKDELLAKDMPELENIANELEAEVNHSFGKEDLVYSILDRQAVVEGNKNPLGGKKRRQRIAKTDHVYSVNGKEGESFEKKNRKPEEPAPLFKEEPAVVEPKKEKKEIASKETVEEAKVELTPEEELARMPKHRGRKTKRELELLALIEKRKNENKSRNHEATATAVSTTPKAGRGGSARLPSAGMPPEN